jgi:hypothetical protein
MRMARKFPLHGVAGPLIVAAGLGTTYAHIAPFDGWTTPICWWGYILFADALLKAVAGRSPLCDARREFFLAWLPLSIVFWLVFEVINLHLENWYYTGLPNSFAELAMGGVVSFATILPGMFITSELIRSLGVFRRFRLPPIRVGGAAGVTMALAGLAMIMVPLLLPREWARYCFAFVWMGFFFAVEPVNLASGAPSILGDLTRGKLERFLSLMAGGYVCGLLWELWNWEAACKWVYCAPFTEDLRYFEMPLAGFLGFGPFALEYFVLYRFARLFVEDGREEPSEAIAW